MMPELLGTFLSSYFSVLPKGGNQWQAECLLIPLDVQQMAAVVYNNLLFTFLIFSIYHDSTSVGTP